MSKQRVSNECLADLADDAALAEMRSRPTLQDWLVLDLLDARRDLAALAEQVRRMREAESERAGR